jgi:hypothetical protein
VTLDNFQLSALVVISGDPIVVSTLQQRLAALPVQAAGWQRDLAAQSLAEYEAICRRLPPRVKESPVVADWMARVRAQIGEADKLLAAKDRLGIDSAYVSARQATCTIEQLRRLRWEQATTLQTSLAASPFTASFDTLPLQARLADALAASRPGADRLPCGDCENVAAMIGAGWRHWEHPLAGLQAAVEPSAMLPHGGRSCMHLQVKPTDPKAPPLIVETAPVWIVTPPLPARQGELLAIRAFVRVAHSIAGSPDGLQIIDSIGGEALSERIDKTSGWRQIVLYRIAPQNGPVDVKFALSGVGQAWIDDISVEPMERTPPP